jgi:hypothetical protein
MARIFFSKPRSGLTPVSGTDISDVQLALNAMGAGNLTADGLYGGQTTTALTSFQEARGLPVNGNVTDATWQALIRTGEPPIFERSLQVVASFEGTGFTLVVGNFDGAGITWGIVGFTLIGGELGILLKAINQSFPDLISRAFSHDADQIMKITGLDTTKAQKTAWADSISRGANKYRVAEPWKTYFHDLGNYREVQKIQIARARDVYWSIATRDASSLGLSEELDYLLMYDVAVQNGGMQVKNRLQLTQTAFQQKRPRTAEAKRKIIANVVADTSSARYRKDVLSRKMTIATGEGTVHGGAYDLADWGFLDGQTPPST